MVKTIGNPFSWTADAVRKSTRHVGEGMGELANDDAEIVIRDLEISDLSDALRKGAQDFVALRTDVMFIVLIYPAIGLLLTWFAVNREMLPLLFPLITGFALLGPVAAVGLYEMSRRHEKGLKTGWGDAFRVIGSPSFVPIVVLGFFLAVLFISWMLVAYAIYSVTLGPAPPVSALSFINDVVTTPTGWAMLIAGTAIGFGFAMVVLAVSLVSFPLLIDRQTGVVNAVRTSVQITRQNPVPVALWGAIVVALLAAGVLTLFVGLIFVLPLLGHATWHLYRRAVL